MAGEERVAETKLTAKAVPFSSIVGSSVIFTDDRGAVRVQVAVMVPNPHFDYRATAEPFVKRLVDLWNSSESDKRDAALRLVLPLLERVDYAFHHFADAGYLNDDKRSLWIELDPAIKAIRDALGEASGG